ncbi:type IV pilin-like G/H family protein [Picosynechococcus sp. PCC 7117]|uniref:type IV pilin-like G/H family protein n=1 Tax=Picosynechococcus sp. PCC 7117 TaxID=195498 RepID=UPI000A073704|nr:type IV pilin-like G/H family protein [Picosynechococcus sp. PCC 7117]
MKNFTFKLLQQLNKKKADKGFTLIELLVVIIIIGILSAIALPAFLNQAAKARQSEAKQALASLNKAQQAAYLEDQTFATNIAALGLGLANETENYSYGDAAAQNNGSFSSPANSNATMFATAADAQAVKDYLGAAAVFTENGNTTTTTSICEEVDPTLVPGLPAASFSTTGSAEGAITCPNDGTTSIELGDSN